MDRIRASSAHLVTYAPAGRIKPHVPLYLAALARESVSTTLIVNAIRPKIARPGGSTTDFLLQTEKDHGVAGLINLFGIESPGLTASLAITDGAPCIIVRG